ncbi:DUF6907 domain-containing protein [Streptomyces sp. NPDC102383]|uniref:DUF6907 domain-containing protein n=1 Tax=Streptomyces sp. NPDC102383 TaxID=3366165 RepID=UPI0038223211
MPDRTVTLTTLDHGEITLPEPSWCAGHEDVPQYRTDVAHEGREQPLYLPTPDGPAVLLTVALEQRPYTATALGTSPFVNVGFSGDWHPTGPAGLDAMASALVDQAAVLRAFARQLSAALGGER